MTIEAAHQWFFRNNLQNHITNTEVKFPQMRAKYFKSF